VDEQLAQFLAYVSLGMTRHRPGHTFVGRRNEYQPKGRDALRLGSKGRYGSCVGGTYNCAIPLLNTGHSRAL